MTSTHTLPGRTATFQGLPSLDGKVLDKTESREFVYNARLEADKWGRPAPVKHWPGMVLEDPAATAAAISSWVNRSPIATGAAGGVAGGVAPREPHLTTVHKQTSDDPTLAAACSDFGTSLPDARRNSSDDSTEGGSETDDERGDQVQYAARPHPTLTVHSSGGWDTAATNPLLTVPRCVDQSHRNDGSIHNLAADARSSVPQDTPGDAAGGAERKASTPVCPFCPAAYDEAVGVDPGRKTRRVRPKAVSRTTQKHGRWWQTLGYGGPAYCQRCSEVFRDHIIRQKPNSAECSREHPCDECAGLLAHFAGGVDLLWQKIDARSYATDSKRKGKTIDKDVQKKHRLSR